MADDRLERYRGKRDFAATPEPGPDGTPAQAADQPRFVVQEHSARSMHWDLRLEHEGVLLSWAVPRGLPPLPKVNHLAVRTEDHPLEYIDFHGDIPAGSYGAGTMTITDTGTYELEILDEDKVQVILHGERYQGRYGLVRTGEDNWLIHRMDPPQDPARKPLPEGLSPMLATAASDPPVTGEWAWEVKWDGIRALAYVSGGRIKLFSRNGIDITNRYPELARLGRALGVHEAIIDGEIVAFDETGAPSFSLLQERMGLTKDAAIRRAVDRVPISYMIFDLLFLDGHRTTSLPYTDRRRLLEMLELEGATWSTPAYHEGDPAPLLAEMRERGFEGIVGKRLDSTYVEGKRGSSWVKLRLHRRQEFVIGGWVEGGGRREGGLGSLLVGYHDESGALQYAGGVGTGFNQAELERLAGVLAPLAIDESPFDPDGPQPSPGGTRWNRRELARRMHFVRPELVCEVEYTELTHENVLRHPSYKGQRMDRDAATVVLEPQAHVPDSQPVEHKPATPKPTRSTASTSAKGPAEMIDVGEHSIRLSNPDKELYPGFTKRQVLDYMVAVAPAMLPHLSGRGMTLKRYPNGAEGEAFFEKTAPSHTPDWIPRVDIPRKEEGKGDVIRMLTIEEPATLAWLANLAAIELHAPLARASSFERPDHMVFDLDPGPPATIVECCEVGLLVHELLTAAGMESFPKTSGRKGLQLYVPLNDPNATYALTRAFSQAVARLMERQHPHLVVSKQSKALRAGKVLVDWSQNHPTKTTIGVYSLRANDRPTASTPVTWDEVTACHDAGDPQLLSFTAPEVLERLEQHGDLFASVLTLQQDPTRLQQG